MLEPIEYFLKNKGFDFSLIEKIVSGERYSAVMLKNGNIGVCATLGEKFVFDDNDFANIDLKILKHRILLNAYFNALLNYENKNYFAGDLLENIDFSVFKNIVMIGYFRPVVEKFQAKGIDLHIFDFRDKNISIDNDLQKEYLAKCDAAIVTATSVFNNTFAEICENSAGKIFVLGPSALMNDYLLGFKNVEGIYGSLFSKHDMRILDIISQDLGTRHFLKLGKKVSIVKN